MGTWISHLRIAEQLLVELPDLDETAFTFGNLAPDSGIPNETWTEFDPPKEITHFSTRNGDESTIHDMEFYRAYLAGTHANDDKARYSFMLGYFFHLLTDHLWAARVWRPSKQYFKEIVEAKGKLNAAWDFKADWYDQDHRYLRDNPDCLFWRVFLHAPLPLAYLHYLPLAAIHQQIHSIRKFYAEPGTRSLDRTYPFLNDATMSRFVNDTATLLLKIYRLLPASDQLVCDNSALALLSAHEKLPYPAPLGD